MMRLRLVSLALWVFAAHGAGRVEAADKAAYDPYKVPRAQFAERVTSIALAPVRMPWDVEDAERVAADFEMRIAAAIEDKGYEVLPSTAWEQEWTKTARQVGGVFDPVTGEADAAKYDLVRDLTCRELARRFDIDAVLWLSARIDSVQPYLQDATFYAVNERLTWFGEPVQTFGPGRPNLVIAPFLNLVIDDVGGVEFYGIRVPIKWQRVYLNQGYETRTLDVVYGDPVRNDEVIEILLGPLSRRGTSAVPRAPLPRGP